MYYTCICQCSLLGVCGCELHAACASQVCSQRMSYGSCPLSTQLHCRVGRMQGHLSAYPYHPNHPEHAWCRLPTQGTAARQEDADVADQGKQKGGCLAGTCSSSVREIPGDRLSLLSQDGQPLWNTLSSTSNRWCLSASPTDVMCKQCLVKVIYSLCLLDSAVAQSKTCIETLHMHNKFENLSASQFQLGAKLVTLHLNERSHIPADLFYHPWACVSSSLN